MISNRTKNSAVCGRRISLIAGYVLLTAAAVIYLGPVLFMVVASLKPDDRVLAEAGSLSAVIPHEATLQNYRDVFSRVAFGRYMLNSLLITGSIVAGGLIVNSAAGYAFARLRWPGRRLMWTVVLSLMILPLEAIAVPLFYEITIMGLRNTYTAQIIPFLANAFSIYLFYTFFAGMPRELEESAYTDGASIPRTFLTIIVPLAKPVFATVSILTFLLYWGLFLWPLMVTIGPDTRPLPVGIAEFQTLPPLKWGDIMAFGVMMVIPVLAVFVIFQRWFVQGVATVGRKG